MKILLTNADNTVGIATTDDGTLQYTCLAKGDLVDLTNDRIIWRGESISTEDVKDRYSVRDTPIWDKAIKLREEIKEVNIAARTANKIKNETELDKIAKHMDDRKTHPGWCDKCCSYCYGDCEA